MQSLTKSSAFVVTPTSLARPNRPKHQTNLAGKPICAAKNAPKVQLTRQPVQIKMQASQKVVSTATIAKRETNSATWVRAAPEAKVSSTAVKEISKPVTGWDATPKFLQGNTIPQDVLLRPTIMNDSDKKWTDFQHN